MLLSAERHRDRHDGFRQVFHAGCPGRRTVLFRVSSEATLVRWQYRPHPAPHTHEWVLDLFYPSDALLNLEFWDTIGLEQEDAPGS